MKYFFSYILILIIPLLCWSGFQGWRWYRFITSDIGIDFHTLWNNQSIKEPLNILLLGIGGGDHEGPNLTDAIMVASVHANEGKVSLLSIPRDIWSPDMQDKINTAYTYGLEKNKNTALAYTKQEIGKVLGLTLDHVIIINFSHFATIVDALGGIEVMVGETFTDTEFPILGKENEVCTDRTYACRYETISFTQGETHMDGQTVLKYVRSRHAKGDAGTDFSRGVRQQEILAAIQKKALSQAKSLNIAWYKKMFFTVDKALIKDISYTKLFLSVRVMQKIPTIKTHTLTMELFEVPPSEKYGDRWVLIPTKNKWDVFQQKIKELLEINY